MITLGTTATFVYPDYGTPVGYPDHVAHSGQTCTIVRELGDDERDPEVGQMFVARFADGAELIVNADEVTDQADERVTNVLAAWDRLGSPEIQEFFDRESLPRFFWTAMEGLR